jgi:hypothetical protein
VVAWIRWLSTDRRERVSEPTTIPDRAQQTHTPSDHSPGGGIYLAFVPWILFSLITQRDSLTAAAVVALIASILIALRSISTSGPKLLEIGAVAAFVGFAIVAVVADASATMWLERYARAIAALMLAAIAFGSLLFTPFTEQYARESVPRQFWSSPRFQQVNRRLTTMWGCVFSAMVVSHVLAGAIDTRRGNTIFNWVIPIILIVWAVKRTSEVSQAASEKDPPGP